jgi:Fibronectin type III domain
VSLVGLRRARRLWTAAVAIVLALVVMGQSAVARAVVDDGRTVTDASSALPGTGQYVPVTPTRIASGVSVAVGGTYTFSPLGRAGVPSTGVSAVALQLSARGSTGKGPITVFPAGAARPTTTNVIYQAGVNRTDLVVSNLGTNGQVSVFNGGSSTAAVYVDVVGYYLGSGATNAGATFVPITPVRIFSGVSVPGGGSGVAFAPLGRGGIPTSNVTAVVGHVIVHGSAAGYATVYPDGLASPTGTTDVSFASDHYYTNLVPAKLGANGRFRVYSSVTTSVYIDVVGYFQSSAGTAAGSSLVGVTPSRILSGQPLAAGGTYALSPLGRGGVPGSGVSAVAFTLTALNTTANGYMTVYPAGVSDPRTGELYYRSGSSQPVLQFAKVGANGQILIHNGGTSAASIYVDVAGYYRAPTAPTAPTGVTATAGDGTATVSWTRPASDGGATITGYRITASPGGASMDVADVTSATAANLTNGTAYTFTVAAINAAGVGAASVASSPVTPRPATVPGAPTQVTAQARNQSALVSWQPPANDGGLSLTGYTVTASPGGAQASVPAASTTATVPNLSNGTAYTFTVKAINAKGAGAASTPSAAVTPGLTPPDPPSDVTASALGNGSITVGWTAPVYTGGQAVTGYTVTVQPGGRTVSLPADVTSTDISSLASQTAYTFTVTARNAIGVSSASPPSTPLTPDLGLTPKARVLSDAALATLTDVTPSTLTSTTLTFTNAPAEVTGLQPGDVLVVGTTPKAPNGLLRTVGQISTSGGTTTIVTSPAALQDAFTDAGFDLSVTPTGNGAPVAARAGALAASGPSYAIPIDDVEIWPGVKLSGSLEAGASMELHHDLINLQGDPELSLEAELGYKGELTLKASADASIPEKNQTLKEFNVSKQPKLKGALKANAALRVSVYVKGSVSAGLTITASIEATHQDHIDVIHRQALADSSLTGLVSPPVAFANANIEVGVKVGLVIQVADQDALRLNGSLAGLHDIDLVDNPWWKTEACVKAGVEALPLLGPLGYKNDEFGKHCETLGQAAGTHLALTVTPTDADIPQGGTVQFRWSSYPYAMPAVPTWTVLGDGNGTITRDGLYTAPAKVGVFTIAVSIGGTGLNPNMSGTATVHVGAPGAPTVYAFAEAPDFTGVPRVGLSILRPPEPEEEFVAYYLVTPNPLEPGVMCPAFWQVLYFARDQFFVLLEDRDLQTVITRTCGMLQPGKTYTFRVQLFNQIGGGPVVTTNPVTIRSF